jgi:hypothetical protein
MCTSYKLELIDLSLDSMSQGRRRGMNHVPYLVGENGDRREAAWDEPRTLPRRRDIASLWSVKTFRFVVQCGLVHLPGENDWRPPVHMFVHEDTHAASTAELMAKARDLACPR